MNQENQFYNDPSMKDVILKIQEYFKYLWIKKYGLLCSVIIFNLIFVGKSILKKDTYTSAMTFMLNDESFQANSTIISPYGEFEIVGLQNNKITELTRSSKIIYPILLSEVKIDSIKDIFANHLINIYDLSKGWDNESENQINKEFNLHNFKFENNSLTELKPNEKRALSILHQLISGNNLLKEKGLMSVSYNDNIEMFKLSIESINLDVSNHLINSVYENLRDFYIQGTVGKQILSKDTWIYRTDSLQQEYESLESRILYAENRNRGLITKNTEFNLEKLKRELSKTLKEYNTAVKNLKNTELSLNQDKPEFQIIDKTFFPILNKESKLKNGIIATCLGLLFGIICLILKKSYKEIMME